MPIENKVEMMLSVASRKITTEPPLITIEAGQETVNKIVVRQNKQHELQLRNS